MLDVAFVVDSSSKSQGQAAWSQMISFVNLIIDRLTISQSVIRIAFVSYSDRANVEFRFNTYTDSQSTKQGVTNVGYLGTTVSSNLAAAFDALRDQVFVTSAGARSNVPWVAVIITDRSPNIRTQDTASIASQLRAAGIQIIPIGVLGSGQLSTNILNQITYEQTRVTTVNTYSQLTGVAEQVAGWVCNSHLRE